MSKIRIDLDSNLINGQDLTFKSPADCSEIDGLIVYYKDVEISTSRTFQFADAHGNNVGSIDLFTENVLVKVILDTELNRAYVQNADTNAYLEGKFATKLPLPPTAQVGQFIKISAVDKDGKVIATEAVSLSQADYDVPVYQGETEDVT